jgi:hypothetical protein
MIGHHFDSSTQLVHYFPKMVQVRVAKLLTNCISSSPVVPFFAFSEPPKLKYMPSNYSILSIRFSRLIAGIPLMMKNPTATLKIAFNSSNIRSYAIYRVVTTSVLI